MEFGELLKGMLLQILDIKSIIPSDLYQIIDASLTTTFGTSNVLGIINNIMKDTIFATGASLLTLFMMMELIQMINRYNSDGNIMGVRLPVNMIIKFGIYAFLYCNLGKIMIGIQDVAVGLTSGIMDSEITIDISMLNGITDVFTNMGLIQQLGAFVLILIVFCITQVIFFIIQTTVYFRIFELFIIYMFAPIPLATLASQEFRPVAINYLKSFFAVCMQSAVILACFKLYDAIIVYTINTKLAGLNIANITSWEIFIQILIPMTGYLFVLAAAVFSSGKISKSIINAI